MPSKKKAPKKKETSEVTLSKKYTEIKRALFAINPPVVNQNGQVEHKQTDLSKIKGDTGTHVYLLKRSMRNVCKEVEDQTSERKKELEEVRELKDNLLKELSDEERDSYMEQWQKAFQEIDMDKLKENLSDASDYTVTKKGETFHVQLLKDSIEIPATVPKELVSASIDMLLTRLDIEFIESKERELTLKRGRLPLSKIEAQTDSDILEAIDFLVDVDG